MHHQYIPALIEAGINASTHVGNIYSITDKMWLTNYILAKVSKTCMEKETLEHML